MWKSWWVGLAVYFSRWLIHFGLPKLAQIGFAEKNVEIQKASMT